MSKPKKFPTIPYEPGDGDKTVNALRSMSRAATGVGPKGPLSDDREPEVWEEIEMTMDWATRDVPEES